VPVGDLGNYLLAIARAAPQQVIPVIRVKRWQGEAVRGRGGPGRGQGGAG